MKSLSVAGRIFYGVAIAGMGLLTVYYHVFPYMLIPPKHSWIPGIATYIFGILLIVAGVCIVLKIKTKPASLLLGTALLLIFCFYFVPYQLMATSTYMKFGAWENAAKELTLASGALVIAGCFPGRNETSLSRFLSKLIPFGRILFSITIISYGIDHFLYAKEAADYVPAWVPYHLFWIYFCGAALLGAGLAIILKIKIRLIATLLGAMILTWFIILHIPRIIDAPAIYLKSEVASALLALAYSGIAFVISKIKCYPLVM